MAKIKIEISVKVVIIGDSGVGKTNLLHRYTTNEFIETKSTLGVDFVSHEENINGSKVKVHFWDTAGQEQHQALTKTYYKEV